MAQKSKSEFVTTKKWAKHLRKWGKRAFNKAHRKAGKLAVTQE